MFPSDDAGPVDRFGSSVSSAEWPQSWRRSIEPRYYFSIVGIVVFLVLVPIAIAVYFLQTENANQAKYLFTFAAFSIIVAWIGYHTRFRRRRAGARPLSMMVRGGQPGLKIPYSRHIFLGYALTMSMVAIAFALPAVEPFLRGNVEIGDSIGSTVFFGAIAVFFASLPLLMLVGKFSMGYIHLSSAGVYQRGWTFSSYLRWEDIIAVHPFNDDGPEILVLASDTSPWERKQITRLWKQDKLPAIPRDDGQGFVPAIVISGRFLAADPALVLYLLVTYARTEAIRAELNSEKALTRAQSAADASLTA